MALRPFSSETKRSTMLTETLRCGRVDSLGQVQSLGVPFCAQRRQHALGGERTLVQPYANRIVNGICDRRDLCCQPSFATLLGAKRSFRIDTFHDDGFDCGRLDRRWTPVLE